MKRWKRENVNNFVGNIGHIVMAGVIIIVSGVLAWHGTITGGEFIGIAGVVGGVSVGGSVASGSAGASVPVSASAPSSSGTSTLVTSANGTVTPVAIMPPTLSDASSAL